MSRKEYLRQTYDSYFERLSSIAVQVKTLKTIINRPNVPSDVKNDLEQQIKMLERDMADYARYLSDSGIDVIKNVA